jgi:hypothetical protein
VYDGWNCTSLTDPSSVRCRASLLASHVFPVPGGPYSTTRLRSRNSSAMVSSSPRVHEQLVGQFLGHRMKGQLPLRQGNCRPGLVRKLRFISNKARELRVSLRKVNDVGLTLEQRRHGRLQLSGPDRPL